MTEVTTPQDIATRVPSWVPKETFPYLAHTEGGASLRAIARDTGVHASTIMRQVRSVEARREDVLVDRILSRLGERMHEANDTAPLCDDAETDLTENQLSEEACRALGHLSHPATVLAVVPDMDKAVVVQETSDGNTERRAIVGRDVAEAMALKGWIHCAAPGRVLKYRITVAGRSALGKILARTENKALGFSESAAGFTSEGRPDKADGGLSDQHTAARFHSMETPLALLARRRDKEGNLFLSQDLVTVGERLREDYILAEIATRKDESWDQFLCRVRSKDISSATGVIKARDRLVGALRDLGPGLGDAALRCCCCLEGLELTEKRMGWSARSGKIVLRIALQRLKRHYADLGEAGFMVG